MPTKKRAQKELPLKPPPPNLGILPSQRPGPATALTPYGDVWFVAFGGGEPPWGELARWIPAFEKVHGKELLVAAFRRYCSQASAQFASVTRFANTLGMWVGTVADPRDPLAQRPGETLDQYQDRLSYL